MASGRLAPNIPPSLPPSVLPSLHLSDPPRLQPANSFLATSTLERKELLPQTQTPRSSNPARSAESALERKELLGEHALESVAASAEGARIDKDGGYDVSAKRTLLQKRNSMDMRKTLAQLKARYEPTLRESIACLLRLLLPLLLRRLNFLLWENLEFCHRFCWRSAPRYITSPRIENPKHEAKTLNPKQ